MAAHSVRFASGDIDSEQKRAQLRLMGFETGGAGVELSFVDCASVRSLQPQYLFCASNLPNPDWARAHQERIFKISDVRLFGRLLAEARPDILGGSAHDRVVYERRERDPFREPAMEESPFKKDLRFAHEDEYRLIWEPGLIKGDYEIIDAPRAAALITEVLVDP